MVNRTARWNRDVFCSASTALDLPMFRITSEISTQPWRVCRVVKSTRVSSLQQQAYSTTTTRYHRGETHADSYCTFSTSWSSFQLLVKPLNAVGRSTVFVPQLLLEYEFCPFFNVLPEGLKKLEQTELKCSLKI